MIKAMTKLKTKDKMTGLNGYEQELKVSVETNSCVTEFDKNQCFTHPIIQLQTTVLL